MPGWHFLGARRTGRQAAAAPTTTVSQVGMSPQFGG
jgi:hypothetical protein